MGVYLIMVDFEVKDNFIKQFFNVFVSELCFSVVVVIIQVIIYILFNFKIFLIVKEICENNYFCIGYV